MTRNKLSATEIRNLRTLLLADVFDQGAIGERIAKAREEAGLRQEDLAELVGVATRTIQNYEAGSTTAYRKINRISEVTGRSVEWILHGEKQEQPDLAGQGLALVLDRLEALEGKLEEQALETVRSVDALRVGIERLEHRLDAEDHREQTTP